MSKVDFFKNTIDEILEEFPNSKALFKEISILFDNFQGNLKYQTYRKEILISILTEEKKPNNLKFSDLENIKDQIILEFYLSDSTIDPYLSIIEYFRSILKNNKFFKSLNSLDSWTKALKLAVYEAKISNSYSKFIDPSDIKTVYSRLYNVGKSARYLRNIGYKVWAEDGKIRISRKEEIRVINDICNKIKSLGGKNVLFRIIEKLKKYNYSKFQNRFLFPLHHSQGTESKDPYFPIGYIFNLSLKYLSYLPSSKNPEKDWEELVLISTSYISAIYDSQSYSIFENLFISPESLPRKIYDFIMYDTIFKIPQLSKENALDFISNIILPLSLNEEIKDTYSILEWISKNQHLNEMTNLFVEQINIPNINREKLIKNLNDISLKIDDLNSNYFYPYDYRKINCFEKPILKNQFRSYSFLGNHFFPIGFLETILSTARNRINSFESKLGIKIEEFLREKMIAKKMSVFYGKYRQNGIEGDCDIGLETNDLIVLIEVKKKGLTDLSRSGDRVKIFYDLSESLIKASVQLGKQELLLYSQGYIEYENENKKTRLEFNNRPVERIVVSFDDYGSLNGKTVPEQILNALCQIKIEPEKESRKEELRSLNKYIDQLISNTAELQKVSTNWKEAPFFNTWFLNISQVLILLEGVQCNTDFKNNLWKTRYIALNTLDFCFEYDYINTEILK